MSNIGQVLTSIEVAEMVDKKHNDLLKDIRRYCEQLNESKIAPVDFFTESTYADENNQNRPCYNVTKKGCEFIAHKLTGTKGTVFTARYINRFHEMEHEIDGCRNLVTEGVRPQPSVETGLQRAGLIIRAAEHKAVPQSEQLRLLDMAIRDLTGTGINFSPTPAVSTTSLMDLPETTGTLKKGKTKRVQGSSVRYYTLSEIADMAGTSAAEFDRFAETQNIKNGINGEWVRVNTSYGEAREFLYAQWTLDTYREEVSRNA